MTAIAGNLGSVKIGAATVAEMDKWDLTIDSDVYDTTAFGSTWKSQIPGLKKWSGTFSGRWYEGDTVGQAILQTDLMTGVTASLVLSPNGTNNYTGTALVKQLQIKVAVSATVDSSYSFEGTGALTYL